CARSDYYGSIHWYFDVW
nr:immunoglobulin heavy chain junction region [Mus musculus]MBK4189082.1 immunoglobulin heavy chain junction region [Mus musculus]